VHGSEYLQAASICRPYLAVQFPYFVDEEMDKSISNMKREVLSNCEDIPGQGLTLNTAEGKEVIDAWYTQQITKFGETVEVMSISAMTHSARS
jgi:hypothetical protein